MWPFCEAHWASLYWDLHTHMVLELWPRRGVSPQAYETEKSKASMRKSRRGWAPQALFLLSNLPFFLGAGWWEESARKWREARSILPIDALSKGRKPQRRGFAISPNSVLSTLLLFSLYYNSRVSSLFQRQWELRPPATHQRSSPCPGQQLLSFLPSLLLLFLLSFILPWFPFFCFQTTFTLTWSWQQPQERKIVVDVVFISLDKKMRQSWGMYPDHRRWPWLNWNKKIGLQLPVRGPSSNHATFLGYNSRR